MTAVSDPSASIASQVASLGPWFHNLHLPDGTQTCPDHWLGDFPQFKWNEVAHAIPQDLRGWRCLDIGCNAGFYSFELARRGGDVLGIDLDDRYLAQARFAAKQYGLDWQVRFEKLQVYDLARRDETFDLVLFLGVLYHLRYPMLGLDIVAQKTRKLLLVQTLTAPGDATPADTRGCGFQDRRRLAEPAWPGMKFLEHGFAGDPTNWWAPTEACVESMLRAAGMTVQARPAHEFFLCSPDGSNPSAMTTWNRAEFLAATGCREER
jgi:tRNA (mo5U34)-methyltransferase